MSWHFSQALVEEYSEVISLDGQQCALLKSNPTRSLYSSKDRMKKLSRHSQSGMTYVLLTENLGEELLTLYLADFHAQTLVAQVKEQELRAIEADYGKSSQGLLAKYDQDTCLWKTAQCSLVEDLESFSETFPEWGMMQNGELYQQSPLEPYTSEEEYGLEPNNETFFHAPVSGGMDGGSNSRKALKKRMSFPTPVSSMHKGSHQRSLIRKSGKSRENDRLDHCVMASHGGPLNPAWVEWLMGWPLNHTDLKPLEQGKYQEWLRQHGSYWSEL